MNRTDTPTALVLGGTSAHTVLVEKLRARGYRVVLADYLDKPPAATLADRHYQISSLDTAAITALARQEQAALVIATSVDQAYVVACEVSETLGLPHPYSSRTGHQIADKVQVKARMVELGIPTATHISLNSIDTLDAALTSSGLDFPLIVKPADCNGSKGVVRCDSRADLDTALARAFAYSRSHQAIVEDFIDGVEYNIYALIIEGQAHLVTSCRKYNHESTDGTAITSFATWYQNRLPDWFRASATEILQRIADGFGLRNTAMILQVLVRDEDMSVLEFAPRVGGGLSYWAVLQQTGCDLVEAMLDAWLGAAPVLPAARESDIVITTHLYAHPCTFDRIEGVEALRAAGTIEAYIPNKMQGGIISAEKASRDRVGSFVLRGSSDQDILDRVARIMSGIEAYDINGQVVTDKETYIRAV